ncbi:uncharacterized protein LOC103518384 [Diaphorina citri]|uniref:Uncharacterized protein LOC103518384 n=1 Tax=Diaphorina citri TaxID=121845 RepID=A0A3Q0JBW3_DIACI|nr:uncharacterized protein LOC103518384 [Diaphorina citri]
MFLPSILGSVGKLVGKARFAFTKNSFLTGFSLGFLAFALKKLLLPFFIGIQIVKSILIAMFLPSILGSVGKLVGKEVSLILRGLNHVVTNNIMAIDTSHQLELNELRKPTSDNPEILRFFRYMKAAKDGQDQLDCAEVYSACATGSRGGGTLETSPPMVTTFNDINRLVHARKMQLRNESESQSTNSVSAHAQRSESTQESQSAQNVSAHAQSESDQGRELSAQDQGIQSGQEGVESTHAQGSELNQGKDVRTL